MHKAIVIILMLYSVTTLSVAQNKIKVTVTDAITNEPVEFAHIKLSLLKSDDKQLSTTDKNGIALFNLLGKSELTVSYLGYKTYSDTINRSGNITVQLSPTIFKIDDVIITGHAGPVKADKSIYNVKVLDLKREQGKAASDLYQLLSTESNIRLQQDVYIGGKMTMQGLSGEYIKILVDGVPVTGRMDGNIDITQINMSNVDHIEIIEGPLSVIYGSGALAGTINIITKQKGRDGISGNVSTYAESVGLTNSEISFLYKKSRNSFGVSGMGYYFNGWDNSDTLYRAQQWRPKTKFNTSAYYMYSIKNQK